MRWTFRPTAVNLLKPWHYEAYNNENIKLKKIRILGVKSNQAIQFSRQPNVNACNMFLTSFQMLSFHKNDKLAVRNKTHPFKYGILSILRCI